jgi:glycosyltransferase involved in cell wall biosynthesis
MEWLGVMRVKNEARYIRESLLSQLPLCKHIVVFDDHSTDHTADIAIRTSPKVEVIDSPFPNTLDEARDKEFLVNEAMDMWPSSKWILFLDGDEVLEKDGPEKLNAAARSTTGNALRMKILYYWNDRDTLRLDGCYGRCDMPRAFVAPDRKVTYTRTSWGGNMHCGQLPASTGFDVRDTSVALWHYSAMIAEERMVNYQWYNSVDPNNQAEDCYRHAIQGDPGGPSTGATLKHAGPLRLVPVTDFLAGEGRQYSGRR